MSRAEVAVALVHHPVLNRKGETSTTSVTSLDVHDFSRSCAMFDVAPVYIVHPAEGMHAMLSEITDYWVKGEGGVRNPGRKTVLGAVRVVDSLEDAVADFGGSLWYTSARPPQESAQDIEKIEEIGGRHLIVFGTGWGLDESALPKPNGWLSPIEGVGMVRHLSVRAALAIYLDRLRRPR